jgi:hypothetical protein
MANASIVKSTTDSFRIIEISTLLHFGYMPIFMDEFAGFLRRSVALSRQRSQIDFWVGWFGMNSKMISISAQLLRDHVRSDAHHFVLTPNRENDPRDNHR